MQNDPLITLHDKHFYLASCADIDDILTPLKKFKIHLFSFFRKYDDGSQIYLSNNPQWLKDYYEQQLFQTSLFESHPSSYQTGFIAWPVESDLKVFLHGREYFNSLYGVTYCEKSTHFSEFYFFSGADTLYLQNFFLNNREIILHFILYFKDRARTLIKKADRYKISTQRENFKVKNNSIFLDDFSNLEQLKKEFFMESKVNNYYFEDKNEEIKKIPPRQLQFIIEFLNFKSIPEIALILNISIRTAEAYFNDIKHKFNCRNRVELLETLKRRGLRAEYFMAT